MLFLENKDTGGNTLQVGSVGITELELKNNYCVHMADVIALDMEYELIDVTLRSTLETLTGIPIYCHTDIGYGAYLEYAVTLPTNPADYFSKSIYTLVENDTVIVFTHNVDNTKTFAVPHVYASGQDKWGNKSGSTYWMYAAIYINFYSGTDYYYVWNVDLDEPAKIILTDGTLHDFADGAVAATEYQQWINNFGLGAATIASYTAPTKTETETQIRMRDNDGADGSAFCLDGVTLQWTGTGDSTAATYTGGCVTASTTYGYSGGFQYGTENISSAAVPNEFDDGSAFNTLMSEANMSGGKGYFEFSHFGNPKLYYDHVFISELSEEVSGIDSLKHLYMTASLTGTVGDLSYTFNAEADYWDVLGTGYDACDSNILDLKQYEFRLTAIKVVNDSYRRYSFTLLRIHNDFFTYEDNVGCTGTNADSEFGIPYISRYFEKDDLSGVFTRNVGFYTAFKAVIDDFTATLATTNEIKIGELMYLNYARYDMRLVNFI